MACCRASPGRRRKTHRQCRSDERHAGRVLRSGHRDCKPRVSANRCGCAAGLLRRDSRLRSFGIGGRRGRDHRASGAALIARSCFCDKSTSTGGSTVGDIPASLFGGRSIFSLTQGLVIRLTQGLVIRVLAQTHRPFESHPSSKSLECVKSNVALSLQTLSHPSLVPLGEQFSSQTSKPLHCHTSGNENSRSEPRFQLPRDGG